MKSSKNSIAALILPTLFGLFFAGMPLVLILPGVLRDARAGSNARTWPEVPCTVLESSVRERGVASYELSVKYEYAVDGRAYTSSVYSTSGDYTFKKVAERLPLLEKFAKGRTTVCRVNPAAPGEAVLVPPKAFADLVPVLMMLLFVCVGLSIAIGSWASYLARRRRERFPQQARASRGGPKGPEGIVLLLFGAVFLSVGLAVGGGLVRKTVRYMGGSRWMQVEGTVLRCDLLRSHSHKGGTSYGVYTAYAYDVDGVRYENDKDALSDYTSNMPGHYEACQEKVASRPAGSKVTVYVNPSDPATSLLDPSFQWGGIGFLMIPVLFVGFGGLALFNGLRKVRKWRRARVPAVPTGTTSLSTPFQDRPLGNIKRTRSSVFLLVFAVVWNAIATCGFIPAIQNFVRQARSGGIGFRALSVLPIVFMALFPLVGILLLVLAIRGIVRDVADPHLKIRQVGGTFRPGMEAQMAYTLEKNAEKVLEFRIRLVGYMSVTVGGGKNRSTEERRFSSREVFRAQTPTQFAQGFFTCSPKEEPDEDDFDDDAEGPHWKFEVRGRLRSGREWTDDYPII